MAEAKQGDTVRVLSTVKERRSASRGWKSCRRIRSKVAETMRECRRGTVLDRVACLSGRRVVRGGRSGRSPSRRMQTWAQRDVQRRPRCSLVRGVVEGWQA